MKLRRLSAKNFRSLHDETIDLGGLIVFIGANASGKSTILDTLRFLHEGVRHRDFRPPVFARGGIIHLGWKGEAADRIELLVRFESGGKSFEWSVRLQRDRYEFHVEEHVDELRPDAPPSRLLESSRGQGWWWSGERVSRVDLKQPQTTCALAAAAADASFPAREIAEFVGRWGFFDPNPFLLRHDWVGLDFGGFDPHGRNLGETLHMLQETNPGVLDGIVSATQSVLGLPSKIEPRESENRFFFVQEEPGLRFPVHQVGVSSGTLRMLALMTALLGEPEANLVGIEEPENYVHPTALSSFVEHLEDAKKRVQIMLTTHSPLLLDYLGDPDAVRVVQRHDSEGTRAVSERDPEAIRSALAASGFGLGELYQTKGFGAN